MKKFEFDLQKLLSYKGQMLDSEMMALAVLNSQMTDLQNKLKKLHQQRLDCMNEFEEKIKDNLTPAACQMYNVFDNDLKEKINSLELQIESLNQQIIRQIGIIKNLKLETKSLETLKASRFDEYKKEEMKSEERNLEEFVSTKKIIDKSSH